MRKVTIQQASRILRLSQAVIRREAREGRLKAYQEDGPYGPRWMVEVPDEGVEVNPLKHLKEQAKRITPWWWSEEDHSGYVHYVDGLGPEDVEPHYLCGYKSDNIWDAIGHTQRDRCPDCVKMAREMGLEGSEDA